MARPDTAKPAPATAGNPASKIEQLSGRLDDLNIPQRRQIQCLIKRHGSLAAELLFSGMTEQIVTSTKKGPVRGKSQKSLDLIEAMAAVAQAALPITGRGVGYKLFTLGEGQP
jgi:hypothetical protein